MPDRMEDMSNCKSDSCTPSRVTSDDSPSRENEDMLVKNQFSPLSQTLEEIVKLFADLINGTFLEEDIDSVDVD